MPRHGPTPPPLAALSSEQSGHGRPKPPSPAGGPSPGRVVHTKPGSLPPPRSGCTFPRPWRACPRAREVHGQDRGRLLRNGHRVNNLLGLRSPVARLKQLALAHVAPDVRHPARPVMPGPHPMERRPPPLMTSVRTITYAPKYLLPYRFQTEGSTTRPRVAGRCYHSRPAETPCSFHASGFPRIGSVAVAASIAPRQASDDMPGKQGTFGTFRAPRRLPIRWGLLVRRPTKPRRRLPRSSRTQFVHTGSSPGSSSQPINHCPVRTPGQPLTRTTDDRTHVGQRPGLRQPIKHCPVQTPGQPPTETTGDRTRAGQRPGLPSATHTCSTGGSADSHGACMMAAAQQPGPIFVPRPDRSQLLLLCDRVVGLALVLPAPDLGSTAGGPIGGGPSKGQNKPGLPPTPTAGPHTSSGSPNSGGKSMGPAGPICRQQPMWIPR